MISLVPKGGHLFYHYLVNFASLDDRRLVKKLAREVRGSSDSISPDKFNDLFERYKNKFYFHCIQSFGGVGARLQRFHLSFLLEFKGISRSGLNVLSSFGLAVPVRTYDRYRKEAVAVADAKLR